MTKRGLLVITIMLVALLLMGNGPAPYAFCFDKALGDQCVVTGAPSCYALSGTCQHDPTGYWSDDPNTPEDEALICITWEVDPASPLEPATP